VAAGASLLLLAAPQEGTALGVLLAVGTVQLALVLPWSVALGVRGYVGAALIGAGAAAAADLLVWRTVDDGAEGGGSIPLAVGAGLGPLAAVLALACVLSFIHQLTRRPPRRDVTDSLGGVSLLAVSVVAPSMYVLLFWLPDGPALLGTCVAAIGAAVVTGHLVDLLVPYPRIVEGVPRGLPGFVLGTGAAMLVAVRRAQVDGLAEQLGAVILGGVLGGLACLIAIGASYAAAERRGVILAQGVVQGVLPFALGAPVGYLMSILVGGQ